jgi:hypothetical protein
LAGDRWFTITAPPPPFTATTYHEGSPAVRIVTD